MANIYKVENPVYLDYDEMWKQYEENMVVITEAVWQEKPLLRFIGGVVRYYGDDKKKLINMWGDLNDSGEYGECYFEILIKEKGGIHIHD